MEYKHRECYEKEEGRGWGDEGGKRDIEEGMRGEGRGRKRS